MTPERRLAYQRVWTANNRESVRQYQKAYRQKNRDKLYAYARAYSVANRVRVRGFLRKWRAANPEASALWATRRRVRELGAPGSHSVSEWRDKCALLGNVCIYCGEARRLGRDHKQPLSRCGSDDISNIVPACERCNKSKGARTAQEFISARMSA